MPELPEIESLRRTLGPLLVGRRLAAVDVRSPRLREPLDREALGSLDGARIEGIRRRAKYLWIDLDGTRTLVVHLGMSGRLTVDPEGTEPARHEHVRFGLDDERVLRYVDPRRFGTIVVLPTGDLATDRRFVRLGIEPLEARDLGARLRAEAERRRGPVKSFLMNAEVVVGVGNIYAAEILWRARVHPRRSVARIASGTWDRIGDEVRNVLDGAIRSGGTTLRDYADASSRPGEYRDRLVVYGRGGESCPRCGRSIRSFAQAGRSTWYCPGCQR